MTILSKIKKIKKNPVFVLLYFLENPWLPVSLIMWCQLVLIWSYIQAAGLYFRGQRIWLAAMEDLMSKGMHNADQVFS